MKHFFLLTCCAILLSGCFGRQTDTTTRAPDIQSEKIEFDTNDYLDQALLDLEAVKE